ncbi:lactate racemase domain-containing protein [Kribbella sp. NBC_00889]|uniref:lactate racemase domain-containing protein n=1 Tax=Kribbella sp. NBC_00889 TaxID=2975974 RepID=UPI0038690F45|nr:lactate racemase domain-containing protein [Kribbella sp. NBC_00889]
MSTAAVIGGVDQVLTDDEVMSFVGDSLAGAGLDGRSVCVIVPDATRSCPLPLLMKAVHQALDGRVSKLTTLVALGTHAEMTPEQLRDHLGGEYDGVLNHEWWKPDTFVDLGSISADRVGEISDEMLRDEVPVKLNRAVVEHDVALVVGPVFPHEVVGFSGGNKYFFPGVAGQEVIDLSHWLGALITSANIIGTPGITPVRALIDEAASLIPAEKLALSVVAQSGTDSLHAIAFGDTASSWRAAADISAQTHIRYLNQPVRRVVSMMPAKYADIWTAAKGFYKVEPIVADGGEVILYAPHVTRLAAMHPEIEEIGYHCRDYFIGQWEKFRDLHWGVLAHSTHLRGAGTWDPATGEHLRVQVTLATGIPEDVVRGANLGYLDPASVDLAALENDPGTLVIPNAGEILHRLADAKHSST